MLEKHKWHLCFRSGRVGGSDAGQVARPGGSDTGHVGLDDSFAKFSFPGSRGPATPIVTLRQAVQLSSMPGRFAETLDSCPPTGQLENFFPGKNSDLGAGSDAGQE